MQSLNIQMEFTGLCVQLQDKTMVYVMGWCSQATSHYMNRCLLDLKSLMKRNNYSEYLEPCNCKAIWIKYQMIGVLVYIL